MKIEEKVNNGRLFLTVFDSNLENKNFEEENKQLIIPKGEELAIKKIKEKIVIAEFIHFIGEESIKLENVDVQKIDNIPHGFLMKF